MGYMLLYCEESLGGEGFTFECGKWHHYHENWYGLFDYKKFKAEKGNNADSGFGHRVAEF